jgi:uncharacterized Zn-binding protein involved in type VI secretion
LPGMLTPGPGSVNVIIGGKPAWRGVPAAAAAAIQAARAVSDAAIKVAEAATVAAAGTPAAPAAKAAEETVKSTAASTMGSMISGIAGGADIHACTTPLPLPPHGPGVVVDGSKTVLINGLPACRQGDTVIEAVGPPDKIVIGLATVLIGDAPIVLQAKADALSLLEDRLAGLKAKDAKTKALAKKWFGDDSDATLQQMQTRVEKSIAKLDSFTDDNFVPAEAGQEDCFAYVYPNKNDKLYLGDDFWSAPATGPDSKAGTLIHETSHYNSVGGTDDVTMADGSTAYGKASCEKLAKENPAGAKNNADSFEYFVEGD